MQRKVSYNICANLYILYFCSYKGPVSCFAEKVLVTANEDGVSKTFLLCLLINDYCLRLSSDFKTNFLILKLYSRECIDILVSYELQ